jgi:hypothetical protein
MILKDALDAVNSDRPTMLRLAKDLFKRSSGVRKMNSGFLILLLSQGKDMDGQNLGLIKEDIKQIMVGNLRANMRYQQEDGESTIFYDGYPPVTAKSRPFNNSDSHLLDLDPNRKFERAWEFSCNFSDLSNINALSSSFSRMLQDSKLITIFEGKVVNSKASAFEGRLNLVRISNTSRLNKLSDTSLIIRGKKVMVHRGTPLLNDLYLGPILPSRLETSIIFTETKGKFMDKLYVTVDTPSGYRSKITFGEDYAKPPDHLANNRFSTHLMEELVVEATLDEWCTRAFKYLVSLSDFVKPIKGVSLVAKTTTLIKILFMGANISSDDSSGSSSTATRTATAAGNINLVKVSKVQSIASLRVSTSFSALLHGRVSRDKTVIYINCLRDLLRMNLMLSDTSNGHRIVDELSWLKVVDEKYLTEMTLLLLEATHFSSHDYSITSVVTQPLTFKRVSKNEDFNDRMRNVLTHMMNCRMRGGGAVQTRVDDPSDSSDDEDEPAPKECNDDDIFLDAQTIDMMIEFGATDRVETMIQDSILAWVLRTARKNKLLRLLGEIERNPDMLRDDTGVGE